MPSRTKWPVQPRWKAEFSEGVGDAGVEARHGAGAGASLGLNGPHSDIPLKKSTQTGSMRLVYSWSWEALVFDKRPFFPLRQCWAGLLRSGCSPSLVKAVPASSPGRLGCFHPEIPRAPPHILEPCEEESPVGGWRGSPVCVLGPAHPSLHLTEHWGRDQDRGIPARKSTTHRRTQNREILSIM